MARKTLSLFLSVLMIITGVIPLHSAGAQEKKEYNIAVLDLDANGVSPAEAKSLSNNMRVQIMRVINSQEFRKKTPIRYTVVERSQMDKIFDEFNIQNTECTDISCAVKFGKILNVERIIIGSVGLVGATYTINVSIADIETAKVLKAADYQFRGASDNLLNRGIPDVVDQLLLDKVRKSHKMLYLVGGAIVTAGIVGFVLSSSSKGKGAGSTGAQEGTITFTISDPSQ
ncbi:MAG: hypothetical protein Q8O92_02695 [Candidatus Latescibacter sp.]|nr:hypothetical protein [Candidatus Latescibacter sp.]